MIGRKFDGKPLEWHSVTARYDHGRSVALRVEGPDGKDEWVDRVASKRVQVRRKAVAGAHDVC